MTPRAWALLGCLAAILLLVMCGCGGSAESQSDVAEAQETAAECERSAYELERTRYRCTRNGELQTLECGEWFTLDVCDSPESCSPGPSPGCN